MLARRLVTALLLRLGSALRAPLRRIVALAPSVPLPPTSPFPAPLLSTVPFSPPAWAAGLSAPSERIVLGHLPTPLMPWACPALADLGVSWVIKRDDMTGVELSGNKASAATAAPQLRPAALAAASGHSATPEPSQ